MKVKTRRARLVSQSFEVPWGTHSGHKVDLFEVDMVVGKTLREVQLWASCECGGAWHMKQGNREGNTT